ncbi:intermembrane lipid transfer protein Vps13D isoform X2 [Cylas formicarius]|uniref:intermembrane lipid transfer protein Vps13D isoform X2 n=1 Tax=Cylas formicarius TaxID=197179 RepID=UPI0029588E39|nr:intermembrane lipid transfer protein Vps13D isoform X2 [Cylas formicarius]
MLEGLITWILNNYLGKYVQLNTDQLSIALLSGKVELENVPLRSDALKHLGLPIQVKSGFIGKVQLQIPVRQIRSAPWVIAFEQLYVVVSPLPVDEWDHETELSAKNDLKVSSLDNLEAKWRLEKDLQGSNSAYYASSYSSWYSYGAGFVSEIIENLQLRIQDVHIRYEDSLSILGKNVACGVTIRSLSAHSCDSNWVPGFVQYGEADHSYKLIELHDFAIYWVNLNFDERFSTLNVAQLAENMCPKKTNKTIKHYLLPCVTAQAHLKRNRSTNPLRSNSTPRIICDLSLEEVPLTLIDWQYNQVISCIKGLDKIGRLREYKWFKPFTSVKEDPRAWWLYAISCLYPGGQPAICRPKPTWESCLQRARQNVKYLQVYRKLLITPSAALTAEEKKLKHEVEWDRDYEDLKVLRELAMSTITLPAQNHNSSSKGRSMLESWFPQWVGWYSSSSSDVAVTASPEAKQLEGEILQVLADTVENNTVLKRDVVFGQFNFCLKSGTLTLCAVDVEEKECCPMLELEFKNLSLNILSKPRTASHLIELSLGAIFLRDKITCDTMFPILVGPPGQDRMAAARTRIGVGPSSRIASGSSGKLEESMDQLFYLVYEKKTPNSGCDYRLSVKSKCLDVVYQPNAVRWLTDFVCLPHQRDVAQSRIEEMKLKTKMELIKNWEHLLQGRVVTHNTWDIDLNISAPQIIFVADFTDQNSAMAVIDFGRLQLRNNTNSVEPPAKPEFITKESEDDDTFLTPCSTPPVSENSDSGEHTLEQASQFENYPDFALDEVNFHNRLYDCYCLDLSDLQILIGKAKDNWRYALHKGTSPLHILDRFNISIQIERRIVYTSDPLYPSLTLNANLPKLVVHLNESKICSTRNLIHLIATTGLPSPLKSSDSFDGDTVDGARSGDGNDESVSVDTSAEISRLLMMQFTVDQLSLELQSRGRCVAELQVAGVKVSFTKRAIDTSVTLTVHSLLLVDALQTFGPDFELLVASHKHVGMDSMSGSLRDSEPTSPTSPASPDPTIGRANATSPVALTQALNTLSTSPPHWPTMVRNGFSIDSEALITIEVVLVSGQEPLQIANIQFNNLDIIANQETIVELMGFIKRVFPKAQRPSGVNLPPFVPSSAKSSAESLLEEASSNIRASTEVTFDFHRLNVLLLRGVLKDGVLCGKKICTATMNDAKVCATVDDKFEVSGSLGGLQVLDLTPEGHMHQRIVNVGRDMLIDGPHPLYAMSVLHENDQKAFSFKVVRNLHKNDIDTADVTIRMASLWYTHSTKFVYELQSCATEFKQYLSNLARSIRTAATDMALGLVHARAEALAQSLNMNKKLPGSIYGSALSFSESASPGRRRRRSSSNEHSNFSSARNTMPQTPYSPEDEEDYTIDINLDIELDSPVLVLPRNYTSPEVFVVHLGRINVNNSRADPNNSNGYNFEFEEPRTEHYYVEIKDMNIFSLNTSSRRVPGGIISRPEVLYSCRTLAKPILHDTILQLKIDREINKPLRGDSSENLLIDGDNDSSYIKPSELIHTFGTVVTALKVSLTRAQYEQLLDTIQFVTSSPKTGDHQSVAKAQFRQQSSLGQISEEDTGVTTLNMDPHVRAKLFPAGNTAQKSKKVAQSLGVSLKVGFEVPVFTVELRSDIVDGEQGFVDLSFRDFVFNVERCHLYETNIQISLRSIFMEDLSQPEGSRQRTMMVSSSVPEAPPSATCISKSCPDVMYSPYMGSVSRGSLPDHLETANVFGVHVANNAYHPKTRCPNTPPPSPTPGSGRTKPERNLVLISSLLVDANAPNFDSYYNSLTRSTSIDFNCLDLMVNASSWAALVDFFDGTADGGSGYDATSDANSTYENVIEKSTTKAKVNTSITVCSLTAVLVRPDKEIARANISNVEVVIKTQGLRKEVDGKLGSMSLSDLTLHGQIYRERFITSGKDVLQFKYLRHSPNTKKDYDGQLTLEMTSVIYVHTKRFVAEIQSFLSKFHEKRNTVIKGIQAATSGKLVRDDPFRLSLILKAVSPMILLPVSSKSTDILVTDLGQLLVTNVFKFSGEPGTISVLSDPESNERCLLDVMSISLQNMDLYIGVKENDLSPVQNNLAGSFKFGSSFIMRKGPSLLTKKFELKLQYERNLHKHICRIVPDSSIYGHLSTLDGSLDLHQYKLIRGLLTFNLGEDTEKICPSVTTEVINTGFDAREEWTLLSIKINMENVSLRFVTSHLYHSPLACINFIRSHLTMETFSNLSQDIDLVSQEIIVIDTRFHGCERTSQCNVFTSILQPVKDVRDSDLVQAEIHSRKRQDHTRVTILLHNMRLMVIFDWWDAIREYIFQEIENISSSPDHKGVSKQRYPPPKASFELKLNVTNSEFVVVEDSSQWDTNAVILKSTTVIKYRPNHPDKPLSCSLNNCEMFSCVLGVEEDTALSIIDPITLNVDVAKGGVLEVQLQFLTIRLSYHDMRMFQQMLDSLPKQMLAWRSRESVQTPNLKNKVATLSALGFSEADCLDALEKCGNKLDDAAIWLTNNAKSSQFDSDNNPLTIRVIEIKANCISLCIIDDCGDSDLPLLELSFSDLELSQLLPSFSVRDPVHPQGYLYCSLASDYYNRVLSGWEPIVEPWICKLSWEKVFSQSLLKNRIMLRVDSAYTFNVNITSTFMDLYKQVKENWMRDFYTQNSSNFGSVSNHASTSGFRRRTPFVPFALKNDTGSSLKFTMIVSDLDTFSKPTVSSSDEIWHVVEPGKTVPFSFTGRDKLRHRNSHKTKLHQLGVKVDGWQVIDPVTVDKVGTYFRDVSAEIPNRFVDIPPARVVFNVALEGSARKLVTVRSALVIINDLPNLMEVKLESRLPHDSVSMWVPSRLFTINPMGSLAVPLSHAQAQSEINVRPAGMPYQYTFSASALSWNQMPANVDRVFLTSTCHTHKGHNYRFCAEVIKEKILVEQNVRVEQPAHKIVLLPALKLVNLLPLDLRYSIANDGGHIKAGSNASLVNVDVSQPVELEFKIENFSTCSNLVIPIGNAEFSCRVKFEDEKRRKLYLIAKVSVNKGARIKVTLFSPYWIVNKTGLPLVFRQSSGSAEGAGQFSEHEQARMVAPLLFSFSDQDGSHTITARVGRGVGCNGTPQWCSNFHVRKGTQYRKLHVTMRDAKPDTVFIVGIEVRSGRGKYRDTYIITISPRYQLHNRSSYKLVFAQTCFTKDLSDSQFQKTSLRTMPNSYMPFHWPRLDKDQLLSVSIEEIPDCCWSGGFKIDTNSSMHVNIRDANARVYFLRLEVVLQGATFYVVFTDADTMPPPIRVDNFSEVSIKFGQSCYIEIMHSTARAHSSVPYAWDEPTRSHVIKLIAPGGVSNSYNMNALGPATGLTYENFIYIAFVGTFKSVQRIRDPHDVESQELVLDVGKNNKVILARKIHGQRSQLWRMTSEGYLQHEGSSPPSHPNAPRSTDNILVLDIANTAPQPITYSRLTLRRVDPRRQSTQKWHFTEEGRLCCEHNNMCVQAEDGFYGLREGGAAVLGLPQPICHQVTNKGVPLEQAIERQRLRPGSGFLSVSIAMDGPTQVITIKDMKKKRLYAMPDDREWGTISHKQRPKLTLEDDEETPKETREFQFNLDLKGIGISLVCRKTPEELIYAHFANIVAETIITPQTKQFCISVKDVQIDNQLLDASVPVVLYVTPPNSRDGDKAHDYLPALDLKSEVQEQLNENAVIFKHLIVRLKKITAIIEEKLLLKIFAFVGFPWQQEENINRDENDYETQRLLSEVSAASAKRYYFGVLKLIPDEIRLSVRTATKLSKHLQNIKKKMNLTLIRFEDAAILLEPFERKHPFETSQFLFKSIIKHFKDELMWQAAIIFGSIDFIGNPLGLMNDVSEGVSGLLLEGNVTALVKNVTHGLSNSAAKVTESLSDGLGKIAMDDCHEEKRQKIRQVESGRSSDHLIAGVKGLGFGFLGGFTGIFKQVYEGATSDGIPGVVSGLGKGVVGAFTKPVVGVLDFASETARAVRDSSKSKLIPERNRLPRCVHGPGTLLPRYDFRLSQGQQYLYAVNDKNYDEKLLAYQVLGSVSEDLLCIVSDKMIRIVTGVKNMELTSVIECPLGDLEICNVIKDKEGNETRYYIEIVMHYAGLNAALVSPVPIKKPRVRCRTADLAVTTSQQINYAKALYMEHVSTLSSDDNIASFED